MLSSLGFFPAKSPPSQKTIPRPFLNSLPVLYPTQVHSKNKERRLSLQIVVCWVLKLSSQKDGELAQAPRAAGLGSDT